MFHCSWQIALCVLASQDSSQPASSGDGDGDGDGAAVEAVLLCSAARTVIAAIVA